MKTTIPGRVSRSVAAIVLLALSGCGTTAYNHTIRLHVDDATHRLGEPPLYVAFLNHANGSYYETTVRHSLGPTSQANPYTTKMFSTGTVTALSPNKMPASLMFGFAVPKLEPSGYFLVQVEPEQGMEKRTNAFYTQFGDDFPEKGAMSIPVRYVAAVGGKGWDLDLTIEVPAR